MALAASQTQKVTDPELLELLNKPASLEASSSMGNTVPVTDPQMLQYLNGSSEPRESKLFSGLMAIPRITSDALGGIASFAKNVPGYIESAKTEVPGLYNTAREHPADLAGQGVAGLLELQNKVKQFPGNISQYGSERLHLTPQAITDFLKKHIPDNQENINQLFGQPQHPGEALLRGAIRDIPELMGAGQLAKGVTNFVKPSLYTDKGLANSIIKELGNQQEKHTNLYNNLWKDAEQAGIDRVDINKKQLKTNLSKIEKYKSPKEYGSLENLLSDPSLQNAQAAQSEMKGIQRTLDDKSRTSSLTGEEKALYKAANQAENHIQENMFKSKSGKIMEDLKDRYNKITKSYAENVVPYKYNKDIQAYKNRELLPSQLKDRLSLGEFAVRKGAEHPGVFRNNLSDLSLMKAIQLLGLSGGALYGGTKAYDYFYDK